MYNLPSAQLYLQTCNLQNLHVCNLLIEWMQLFPHIGANPVTGCHRWNPLIYQFELVNIEPRPTPVHEEVDTVCRANILTEKILGNGEGQVESIQAAKIRWLVDNDGNKFHKKTPASEFTVDVDLILLVAC